MKRTFLLILAIVVGVPFSYAGDWSTTPPDPTVIECLILLHKELKKGEDSSLEQVGVMTASQTLTTKVTDKFNDVRTTLDTKMNNVYSYIVLSGIIGTTTMNLYKLITEYKDFSENTYKYVKKKPMLTLYYANANDRIAKEVKHCYKLYANIAANGFKLAKSTMKEKMDLVFILKGTISKIRAIINDANWYCQVMIFGGWKPDYIWDILTSDVLKDISTTLINNYSKLQSKL